MASRDWAPRRVVASLIVLCIAVALLLEGSPRGRAAPRDPVASLAKATACSSRQDPAGGAGIPAERVPTPIGVTRGIAEGNLWNTVSAAGRITQCYGPMGLATRLALHHVVYRQPGPAGFPEIGYGRDLVDVPFCLYSASLCPRTRFPTRLSGLPAGRNGLTTTVRYRLGRPRPRQMNLNVAYDLWLERAPRRARHPQAGDVEVMLSLHRHGVISCGRGSTSWSDNIRLDGRRVRARWRSCNYVGGSEAQLIPVVLESPSVSKGTVTLALKPLIARAVKQAARTDATARWGSYALMGIEFGAEIGWCRGLPCRESALRWTFRVSKLVLNWGSTAIPIVSSR
jgi:hypothetical protein